MLHAFSSTLQASVGSTDCAEMIGVIEALKQLPLDGAVVTSDAAFTNLESPIGDQETPRL